jgi:hypothetical protein
VMDDRRQSGLAACEQHGPDAGLRVRPGRPADRAEHQPR